nr:hypothetical protein [Cystobacter sp.]
MRTVRFEGYTIYVSDDPNRVIGSFLSYALSLQNISKRPPAEEFADRFSPEGRGLSLPDLFVAYRAESPDDFPPEFSEESSQDLSRKELWVLSRLEYGHVPDSAVIEGPELRHLLQEALSQDSARPGS